MTSPTEPLPRRRVLWAALACAFYLSIFARVLWHVGDEGTIVNGAQRVARGDVPYRDFFEVMGPGSFYWLAGWFRVFGDSWLALRTHLVLTGAALSALIYCLTLRVHRGRFEALPCALLTVVGIPMWPASSHHWDANLFALAAITSFVEWQRTQESRWLFLTGGLAAVTTCVIQQKGALVLVAAAILLIVSRRSAGATAPPRRLLYLLTAYAAVMMLVALFFLRVGALGDLLYATIVWPATQYHGVNRVPYGMATISALLSHVPRAAGTVPTALVLAVATASFPLLAVMWLLPAVAVVLLVAAYRRNAQRVFAGDSIVAVYLVFGTALFISELQRPDIYHLIRGASVLLIAVFALVTRLLTENRQRLLLWTLSASVVVFGGASSIRALGAHDVVVTRHGAVRVPAPDPALQFVLDHVSAGSTLFVYPYYPMYYYLADVKNPTRYSILMYHMNTSAQFDETIAALERERVEYVLWDTVVGGGNLKQWFPTYTNPPDEQLLLEHYLMKHYDVLETANGFRILRRHS